MAALIASAFHIINGCGLRSGASVGRFAQETLDLSLR